MKKILIVTIICLGLLVIAWLQFGTGDANADPRGDAFAGSKACIKCHSNIYNSYLHTAHYVASMPATENNIHGSFAKGHNEFNFNATEKIVMEKSGGSLLQTYYRNNKVVESHRFDIVLGGIKGESYLFWKDNGLAQLPISYYTGLNQWLLSPGYAPGHVNYGRNITRRCLECHASFIGGQPGATGQLTVGEQFDKSSLVYSVDCERCHGPAAQHVDFQTNNPLIKTAKYIVSYRSLSRAQRIDICGVCHSGNKSPMLASTFNFKPGDTLSKFKLQELINPADTSHLDVHGNQVQLLASSKCFINSKMDCATCHNTHQNQHGNIALYTQKCLSCHSTANHNYCKMVTPLNARLIKTNCVQCHMPALASKVIIAPTIDKMSSADILVHTHRIAIYPQEAKRILAYLNK